ncbi:hypothetical protein E2C01_084944 [Portunus trituberculatus]|uniref:Uncharacterized protein n=1 Tax=Portunus trituberculatus TaxID=210409 RepID=A0A5B7JAM2_PORTR|nr:hypothetical protein [Portunus trituberculatus]
MEGRMQMTPSKLRVSPQKEVFSTGTGFGVDVGGSDGSFLPLPLTLPSYDLARLACRGLVRRLDPATPRTDDHPTVAPPCAPGLPRPAPPCHPLVPPSVPPRSTQQTPTSLSLRTRYFLPSEHRNSMTWPPSRYTITPNHTRPQSTTRNSNIISTSTQHHLLYPPSTTSAIFLTKLHFFSLYAVFLFKP